jgi:hypothetical protein
VIPCLLEPASARPGRGPRPRLQNGINATRCRHVRLGPRLLGRHQTPQEVPSPEAAPEGWRRDRGSGVRWDRRGAPGGVGCVASPEAAWERTPRTGARPADPPTRGGDRVGRPPGGQVLPGSHRRLPRSVSDGGSADRRAVRLFRGSGLPGSGQGGSPGRVEFPPGPLGLLPDPGRLGPGVLGPDAGRGQPRSAPGRGSGWIVSGVVAVWRVGSHGRTHRQRGESAGRAVQLTRRWRILARPFRTRSPGG